ACGVRLPAPCLDSIIQKNNRRSRVVLCCPKMTAPDNLGSLIRLGASFGIQGILLGPGSVDPYIRRVIRVSLGTCFDFPVRSSPELFNELRELQSRNQAVIIAAEKTDTSSALNRSLRTSSRNGAGSDSHEVMQEDCPIFVLLGNEADGLTQQWLDLADETFHIPIQDEVDSLNVTHAAAIFLYELTR
ncbi:MAG: RNA methyltransferase, partial [Planctomycetaceae bacterium]|nr:RNA methyltransferase [Planctomycetaceae bacterium]